MLNAVNERELAYLVKIDNITPIAGYDRVELAHVGGWTIVVGKNEFKPGDIAVYFEIDSQLPAKPPFVDMEFLTKKHFKVKTQRMCKSVSQGLLMSVESFGWSVEPAQFAGGVSYVQDSEGCQAGGPHLVPEAHLPAGLGSGYGLLRGLLSDIPR